MAKGELLRWQEVEEADYFLYVRSFQSAAQELARRITNEGGIRQPFEVSPILTLYRQAIELALKAAVLGAGSNFLPSRPDVISVSKTRSLSWLSQFVCQIVTILDWEKDFHAASIPNLDAFRALVNDANSIDGPYPCFQFPVTSVVEILAFLQRLDELIELLDATSDAFEGFWAFQEMESDTTTPTIH